MVPRSAAAKFMTLLLGLGQHACADGPQVLGTAGRVRGETQPVGNATCSSLMLTGIDGSVTLTLPPYMGGAALPPVLQYAITGSATEVGFPVNFSTVDASGAAISTHILVLPAASKRVPGARDGSGMQTYWLRLYDSAGAHWPDVGKEPAPIVFSTFFLPGWTSLLPPLVTLGVCIATRLVLVALLLGIWTGATLLRRANPLAGLLRTFDMYFVQAFTNGQHASVLLFTFILGGLIAVVQKCGGALGLATVAKRLTTDRKKAQWTVFGLACTIFFDDYSSILIVGNSLRPILGAVGLSPEKFGVIVHTMGVSLASFFPVSSWVGVEIGYIAAQYTAIGLSTDPFSATIASIPLRFFPVLCVVCIPLSIAMARDHGKLLVCERAALAKARGMAMGGGEQGAGEGQPQGEGANEMADGMPSSWAEAGAVEGQARPVVGGGSAATEPAATDDGCDGEGLNPKPGTPLRWYNAAGPFGVVILATFVGMYLDGVSKINGGGFNDADRPSVTMAHAFANCDSVSVLIWASTFGWILVTCLAVGQRLLTLAETMEAWVAGVQDVLEPCIVLLLAWALGSVVDDVHTADFLAQGLQSGLPAGWLPFLTTLLAYVISFACGSSFGTMGIMFPLVIPLANTISGGDERIVLQCVASILGGAIFGNTCSPIADTTILTALATGCEISAHTETQLPPMLTVGAVSLLFGTLPVGLGWYGEYVGLLTCIAVLASLLRYFGENPEDAPKGHARANEPEDNGGEVLLLSPAMSAGELLLSDERVVTA